MAEAWHRPEIKGEIMKTNPNDAAFGEFRGQNSPLTKREYLAAMAMQGLLANSDYNCPSSSSQMATVPNTTKAAAGYADALIAALNQEDK